jgi:hypothetical protein
LIKVNYVRIYQSMIEHGLGVHETCRLSRINHKTLKKMLAGFMVRSDAVRRLSLTLEIPVVELLVISNDAPRREKMAATDPETPRPLVA